MASNQIRSMWALVSSKEAFSPLLFHYLHEFDRQKCIQPDECAAIGNSKISRLLFAYDLVLLSSTESSLQCRVVNGPISSGPNPKTNLKQNHVQNNQKLG